MADENPDPKPEQGINQRVASLEAGQESMSQKIDKILGMVSGDTREQDTGEHEDKPTGTNVAHEIRAGIEAHEKEKAAAEAEQGKADRLAAAEARIAELSEKPPAPMPRAVERIMGWR